MTQPSVAAIEASLGEYCPPFLSESLAQAKALKAVTLDQESISVRIQLGYPVTSVAAQIESDIRARLNALAPGYRVQLDLSSKIVAHKAQASMKSMAGIKNIVAVASGKGGVGKSTTTVNLALALAAEGARVGILDADIYGPSQGLMLGIEPGVRPEVIQDAMLPIKAHGLQAMSMSFLVEDNQAMVWRGPMASGALQQLLTQTQWDELDYLFVDMPPGTGDIQLTLSQKVPVTGALIVTTPQDIALLDARKGIEMFNKVDIPVLGIVENMSLHICSQCGHQEPIFGEGGGEKIAAQYDTELLGQLPLTLAIRQQADSGKPTVVAAPESAEAKLYRDIALTLAARLSVRGKNYANAFPEIVVQHD